MIRRTALLISVAITTLLITSCSSLLAPRPDRTRYYVLSAVASTSSTATQADFIVGLGPLKLPDYLNRSERAIRVGANQIRFSEDERWAEPPDANIIRVLSQDL